MLHLFFLLYLYRKPPLKRHKGIRSWGILVSANHSFPAQETTGFRTVPFPPTIRKGFFFLHPHAHRSDLRSHWESNPAVSEGPELGCSLWMQSNTRPLFEFPGNPSPSMQVSSGGEGKRPMYHAGDEGLFPELSSKKPHLPMCSVKMEKGDLTPESENGF